MTDNLPPNADAALRFIYALGKMQDGEMTMTEAFAASAGIDAAEGESAIAVLVERGMIDAQSDDASVDETPSHDEIASTLNALVQDGDLNVTSIGEDGQPSYKLSGPGSERAEGVLAKHFGISLEDFRACPDAVKKRICSLVVGIV